MRWAEGRSVRVAVAQTAPELGATAHNLDTLIDRLGQAARDGAQLIVFPECAVSGYMVDDVDELDRLVAHGNTPFAVHDTPVGRIGLAICYDVRFPEPARMLALMGADIIAFPSNSIYTPGHFETHWFADRRTDLYAPLTDDRLWSLRPLRKGQP